MTDTRPIPPPPAVDAGDLDVRFFELAGPDARAALAPLADAWRRTGALVELLSAVDQDDLWLLVVRGGHEPEALPVPRGARVWRFRSVAP
ncbi:MAG: hypothetical protein ABR510_03130 [Trueperaceae bacterium]